MMSSKAYTVLIIALAVGILLSLGYIARSDMTSKESAMMGILLTILSFIASWLVSQHFANAAHGQALKEVREQHKENLRTYALNAAEKVSNLSNELGKLSIYLQKELEKDEENTEQAYLSSMERIESAIHITNTLKSVNDTYLSDWKGVIGEELDERIEEEQEREEEVKELVARFEAIIQGNASAKSVDDIHAQAISKQIDDLRKELSIALTNVSGTLVKSKPMAPTKPRKNQVENNCPGCGNPIRYSQRAKNSSYKTIRCSSCLKRSAAKWYEDKGFVLELETSKVEHINCPWCTNEVELDLSTIYFDRKEATCIKCSGRMQAYRTPQGIIVAGHGMSPSEPTIEEELTEDVIQRVKVALPSQPWPTGTSKKVSQELGIDHKLVSAAINHLMQRGDVLVQFYGKLFEPIRNGSKPL